VISFISTITLAQLKKAIKVKAKIVRAIPLPPISLKKGPVPICPPNIKVKNFFNKIGTTVEIKNEKSSINFWSTSGMMAPFYELLRVMTDWLVKRGVRRDNAQKYITSLFLALSEDAAVNSKKDLHYPFLSIKEYFNEENIHPKLNFLSLTLEDLSDKIINKIGRMYFI
jgi:pyrroline-5-carboxylate reductase